MMSEHWANGHLRGAARNLARKADLLCDIQKMREAMSRHGGTACKIVFRNMYCEYQIELMGEDTVEVSAFDESLCAMGQYVQSELALLGQNIGKKADAVRMKRDPCSYGLNTGSSGIASLTVASGARIAACTTENFAMTMTRRPVSGWQRQGRVFPDAPRLVKTMAVPGGFNALFKTADNRLFTMFFPTEHKAMVFMDELSIWEPRFTIESVPPWMEEQPMFDDSRPLSDEQREYTKAIRWHLQIIGHILHIAKTYGGNTTREEKRVNTKLEEAWLLAKQHIEKCPDAAGHRLEGTDDLIRLQKRHQKICEKLKDFGLDVDYDKAGQVEIKMHPGLNNMIDDYRAKIKELEEQRRIDKETIDQFQRDQVLLAEHAQKMEKQYEEKRGKFNKLVEACNEEGYVVTWADSLGSFNLCSNMHMGAPSWRQLYADKNTECEQQRKLYQDKCKDHAVLYENYKKSTEEYNRRLAVAQEEVAVLAVAQEEVAVLRRNRRASATAPPVLVQCNPCFQAALTEMIEVLAKIGINFSYSYNGDPNLAGDKVGLHVSLRSAQDLANWSLGQCAFQQKVDTPITKT